MLMWSLRETLGTERSVTFLTENLTLLVRMKVTHRSYKVSAGLVPGNVVEAGAWQGFYMPADASSAQMQGTGLTVHLSRHIILLAKVTLQNILSCNGRRKVWNFGRGWCDIHPWCLWSNGSFRSNMLLWCAGLMGLSGRLGISNLRSSLETFSQTCSGLVDFSNSSSAFSSDSWIFCPRCSSASAIMIVLWTLYF